MADESTRESKVRSFVNTTLAVILGAFIFTAGSSWIEGLVSPARVGISGIDTLRPVGGLTANETSAEQRAAERQSVREQKTNESGRILEGLDPSIDQLDHAQ